MLSTERMASSHIGKVGDDESVQDTPVGVSRVSLEIEVKLSVESSDSQLVAPLSFLRRSLSRTHFRTQLLAPSHPTTNLALTVSSFPTSPLAAPEGFASASSSVKRLERKSPLATVPT
jgi:hypothetical protein